MSTVLSVRGEQCNDFDPNDEDITLLVPLILDLLVGKQSGTHFRYANKRQPGAKWVSTDLDTQELIPRVMLALPAALNSDSHAVNNKPSSRKIA